MKRQLGSAVSSPYITVRSAAAVYIKFKTVNSAPSTQHQHVLAVPIGSWKYVVGETDILYIQAARTDGTLVFKDGVSVLRVWVWGACAGV